ncbi:MAG: DUF2834 domain-containing protein [Rhodobacteraceae bacterium]|nr:DUF2834 domain-containing protein [Paracoccaceae bacterium]
MSLPRMIYLALALWGAVHPAWFFWRRVAAGGADPRALIAAWQAGAGGSALLWELAIVAAALWVWIVAEVAVRRNWSALWAIPATALFGPGCGLPLYLFLRTRPVV